MEIVRLGGQEPAAIYERIAQIHSEVIHEGFLSTLGPRFLADLYRHLAGSQNAFLLAATDGTRVLGFIAGSTGTGSVYKEFIKSRGIRAAIALAPKLASPGRIKRVVETLLYPSRQADQGLPDPEILNFCVDAGEQGSGVGSKLFDGLCKEFASRDIPEIRIVTGESQESAQAFYEKRGATLAKTVEVHKGTPSRIYVYRVLEQK